MYVVVPVGIFDYGYTLWWYISFLDGVGIIAIPMWGCSVWLGGMLRIVCVFAWLMGRGFSL